MAEEPSEEFSAICKAIGYVVIRWSIIERNLDNCAMLIFHRCGGDKISKELPRSLKTKIAFLRKAFREIEMLDSFKDNSLELLKKIASASEERHDFVHGTISKYTPKEVRFSRLIYGETRHKVRHKNFTIKRFLKLVATLEELGPASLNLAFQLMKSFPRKK